ncbi:MAG: ribonuclease Z [Thermoprotei archaeon]|nr:MAG: ribonuclease Z [Thermoprotei archaeon]RLF00501.1 MAG: ribonuclease Z [Thermoprotei archaeon]HDI74801.1 ribonuclease Z [Thermoprotei archaeon]
MSKVRLIFLGTGGSIPSKKRALPAIAVKYLNTAILLDCGEGCQYRIFEAGLGLNKVKTILVTHMHGDHVLGLPGILQTYAFMGRSESLVIIGPRGLKDFVESVLSLVPCALKYKIDVIELDKKHYDVIYEDKTYKISAVEAEHTIKNYAYLITIKEYYRKIRDDVIAELGLKMSPELYRRIIRGEVGFIEACGKRVPMYQLLKIKSKFKIVYTGDTRPCRAIVELARGADILIHDATFSCELNEKARATGHSTAAEAALVAKEARVKELVLFHISARYSNASKLLVEASAIFPETILPNDMDEIERDV